MQIDAFWDLQESALKTALGFSAAALPKLAMKGLSIAGVQRAGSKRYRTPGAFSVRPEMAEKPCVQQ